ncbi:hypothetical protein [Sorangium sp. So ce1099]|uniref:hypothetical protein n=1 Tax=Sorangium sp. So ce1099 TaxID=3133331 RepID=UPI003F6245C9
MPSVTHEALVELFKNRPTLAAEMLHDALGHPVPAFTEARVEASDLTEIVPSNRRADVIVVLLVGEQQRPAMAIVVEVQLGVDPDKPYAWPVYVTQTRARHRCPTRLLVVTIKPAMVRWCSRPIDTGHPGWTLTPLVLGPEGVPVVTDAEQAKAAPEVVVLSAMAHGQSEAAEAIGVAFLAAAAGLDEERRALYGDLVLFSMNEAARRTLEAMMKSGYEFQSEFARTYVAHGRREGREEGLREGREEGLREGLQAGLREGLREGILKAKAHDVLAFLEARGLGVPVDLRQRVLASTDIDELDRWVRRAAVVSDARELLATPGLREGLLKAKAHDVLAILEARGLDVPTEVRERVLASADVDELDRWVRRAAVVSDTRELLGTAGS